MVHRLYEESFKEVFELLFNKIPVLSLDQLSTYMSKYYEMERHHALKMIELFSNESMLIVTPNGYVTTRKGITRVSLSEPKIKYKSHLVMENDLILSKEICDIMDAFWILILHKPKISQFVFTEPPILLTFVDEENNKIIEIVKYRKGEELLTNQYLKLNYSYDKESRQITERYAILEDPNSIDLVGRYGFTRFYIIEHNIKQNRDICKTLKERRTFLDAWRDAENYEKLRE